MTMAEYAIARMANVWAEEILVHGAGSLIPQDRAAASVVFREVLGESDVIPEEMRKKLQKASSLLKKMEKGCTTNAKR